MSPVLWDGMGTRAVNFSHQNGNIIIIIMRLTVTFFRIHVQKWHGCWGDLTPAEGAVCPVWVKNHWFLFSHHWGRSAHHPTTTGPMANPSACTCILFFFFSRACMRVDARGGGGRGGPPAPGVVKSGKQTKSSSSYRYSTDACHHLPPQITVRSGVWFAHIARAPSSGLSTRWIPRYHRHFIVEHHRLLFVIYG